MLFFPASSQRSLRTFSSRLNITEGCKQQRIVGSFRSYDFVICCSESQAKKLKAAEGGENSGQESEGSEEATGAQFAVPEQLQQRFIQVHVCMRKVRDERQIFPDRIALTLPGLL